GFMKLDDIADLPIHPNCRCDYIPDVEGWLPPKAEVVGQPPGGPAEWPRFKAGKPLNEMADQSGYIRDNWYYRTGDVRPTSKLMMKDATAYNKALEVDRTAAKLLNAVADSPRHDTLYRGIHLFEKDIPKSWVKGGKPNLPLSSFTTDKEVAEGFMTMMGTADPEVRILIELRNAKGLALNPLPGPVAVDAELAEVIAAGSATVTSTSTHQGGLWKTLHIVMEAG
ncbi:hypothetical protein LCGC14_2793190, partial [marine sediment metagenome]